MKASLLKKEVRTLSAIRKTTARAPFSSGFPSDAVFGVGIALSRGVGLGAARDSLAEIFSGQLDRVLFGKRLAEKPALNAVALLVCEIGELGVGFDSFRDNGESEFFSDLDDVSRYVHVPVRLMDAVDENLVDFENRNRQLLEVA